MAEEDISQEFRLKKIKEMNNYFNKEIDQNELFSKKNRKIFATLNCIEHFITLVYAVTVRISISTSSSLIDICRGVVSSTIELKIWAIIAWIQSINQ